MRIISAQQERANRVEALTVYPASQDKSSYHDNLGDFVFALRQAKSVKLIKDARFPRLCPVFVQCKDGSQGVFFLSTARRTREYAIGNERTEALIDQAADLMMSAGVELPANAKTVVIVSFVLFTPTIKGNKIVHQHLRRAGISRAFTVTTAAPPTGAGATLLGGWLCRFAETGAVLVADALSNFSLKVWGQAAKELGTSLLHVEPATKPVSLLPAATRTSMLLLASQKFHLDPKRVKDGRNTTNDFKLGMKQAVQQVL